MWKLSMNKYLPFYKYIMALPLVLALSLSTVKHPYELSSSPTFGHTYRLKFKPDSGTAIQSHLCFNPSYPILHCQYYHSTKVEDAIATTVAKNLNTLWANTSKNHSVTYAFQDATQIWHTNQVRQIGLGSKIYWAKTYCYFFNP